MSNKQMYEEAYQRIKNEALEDLDYDEADLDIDSVEDEVNRETDARFTEEFGFDYLDTLDDNDDDEPIGIDENEWEEEDIDWLNDQDEDDEDY